MQGPSPMRIILIASSFVPGRTPRYASRSRGSEILGSCHCIWPNKIVEHLRTECPDEEFRCRFDIRHGHSDMVDGSTTWVRLTCASSVP